MDANTYQKLASRTRGELQVGNKALLNWALGLSGETGEVADLVKKHVFHGHELDRDKLLKELGDVCWYTTMLSLDLACPFDEIVSHGKGMVERLIDLSVAGKEDYLTSRVLGMSRCAGKLADIIEDVVFHGLDIGEMESKALLSSIMLYVNALACTHDSNLEEVWELNIKKLRARYPEGFSSEASINREATA